MDSGALEGRQRHDRIYLEDDVVKQGNLVCWWWRLNYIQYTWLSLFGIMCRLSESRNSLTKERLMKWSERYVLTFLVLAAGLFAIRTGFEDRGPWFVDDATVWLSTVIGAYRVYEIVFAQAYYLMQTAPNKVTSFTRTLLFHIIFIVEISLHSANIALHENIVPDCTGATCGVGHLSVWGAFARAYQSLTLQGNFLEQGLPQRLQVVYGGCTVVGLVILVGSLPMIVSAASKSLGEHRQENLA
jgi:hypothetical protein